MQNAAIMPVETGSPLFILSCERSGSTLLRYIMDTHPEICCPGQLFLGNLCHALYTSAYYSISQASFHDNEENKQRIALTEARHTVRSLMGRYTAAKGKRIWCDKTTANTEYLQILDRTFPEARYILLFRHCMDVAHSCIKTSKFGFMQELSTYVAKFPENFVCAVLESWIDKTRKLLEFEDRNKGRTHRITYESLVSDPNQVLPDMFQFLGVEWNRIILEQCFQVRHDPGEGDTKLVFEKDIHANSIGKGYVIPETLIPDWIRDQADNLLMQLGYRPIDDYLNFHERRQDIIDERSSIRPSMIPGIREFVDKTFVARAKKTKEVASLANQCCKFIISGVEGGIWVIDPSAPEGIGILDNQAATCTISLTSDLLLDIIDRKENPVEAYEEGKIDVIGNADVAFEFGRILFT